MKKKLSLITALLCITLFTVPSFAETSTTSSEKSLKDLKVNYETMCGHEGRSRDQLIEEMLNDGLSQNDANFYADMDILVNQIELQNINVDGDLNEVQKLSDQYARLNPDELRERTLALEPSALKTLLNQKDAICLGAKDAQQLIKTLQKNHKGYNITIEYPDGSKLIQSSNTVKEQPESPEVETNTYVSGPWNSSSKFYSDYTITTAGDYVTTDAWQYETGVSIARVEDVYRWTLHTNSPWSVSYNSDTGASSYAGVVTIGTEYLSNHVGTSSNSTSTYIQGYTDVRFTVSGKFVATFQGLGVNLDAGAGWHEYCITEVDGIGDVYGWAAQFI